MHGIRGCCIGFRSITSRTEQNMVNVSTKTKARACPTGRSKAPAPFSCATFYTYKHMYICMCICIYIYIHTNLRMHVCLHIHICMCVPMGLKKVTLHSFGLSYLPYSHMEPKKGSMIGASAGYQASQVPKDSTGLCYGITFRSSTTTMFRSSTDTKKLQRVLLCFRECSYVLWEE